MFSYVQNTMHVGEKVLFMAHVHWSIYFDKYLNLSILYTCFCFLMTSMAYANLSISDFFWQAEALIGFLIFCRIIYMWTLYHFIEMAVTNYRVVYKKGIFSIKTDELENQKIESVQVNQSFAGRILNYGDILFSGSGTTKLKFERIANPWQSKQQIESAILENTKRF